eukprot:TRINITY_DN6542_c0_g1_i2.p1 TRINITY_DN6542_c0_g1~~TRINITY_DN6542_c0_g1_i2.p1  ORF type:complete len:871 (+),score=150.04 TRINITY_DN6542_c0_g1_i2:97-2709(+)
MESSKFFRGGGSSEEEEEEELSDLSEEEESEEEASESSDEDDDDEARGFLVGAGSSDSDDSDDKVEVQSKKTKQLSEFTSQVILIRNQLKINDWSAVQSTFENVNKQLSKLRTIFANPSFTPRRYVRMLADLEKANLDTLADKELLRKKMSTTNAKAANAMKQRIKKVIILYEDQLKQYNENPWDSEDEMEDDEKGEQQQDEEDQKEAEKPKEDKKDALLSMDPAKIPYEDVSQKIREIVQTRGKRGTSKQEQVDMIEFLVKACKGPAQQVETVGQLVSSLFDLAPGVTAGNVPLALWRKIAKYLLLLLQLLKENTSIVLDENQDFSEERNEEPTGDRIVVWGNLVAFVERLDDELFKIMQVTDPHTNEYLERMRDEPVFLAIAQMSAEYLKRIGDNDNLARIVLRVIEHLYYKAEPVYKAVREMIRSKKGIVGEDSIKEDSNKDEIVIPNDFDLLEDPHVLMADLTKQMFDQGDERSKARAALCRIYHRCIHDAFYEARDLMLMSHLQDNINAMDVPTQILHNRAIAQLGLAAFRKGLIQEAYHCLAELYSSRRIKELLAQGVQSSRYTDKTPEQEKLERLRQMPFHLHINLDMLETAQLVSAMLLDVAPMAAAAAAGSGTKAKVVSKIFQQMLENYEKQHFIGPPENVRDHVMASARALLQGDWRSCWGFLSALYIWKLMPEGKRVLETLQLRVKEEGLRSYLLTYGSMYSTLSMSQLVDTFELQQKQVKSVVSKMMLNEELQGSWDQPTNTIVMHSISRSRCQEQMDQLFDKVGVLCDLNERALALRSGSLHDVEEEGGKRKQWEEGAAGRVSNRAQGQRLGLPFNFNSGRGRGRGRDGAWGGRRGRRGGGQASMQNLKRSGQNKQN